MAIRMIYLCSSSGRAYVAHFIDGIANVKERAAVVADLTMLTEEGPILPFPMTSAIRAFPGIRELRTRYGNAQYRVLYVVRGSEIVLLHAFKKTATTQTRREYATAASRARSL